MDKLKELKDLNLLDRFLFAVASEDPGIMTPILEIILGKDIVLEHLPQRSWSGCWHTLRTARRRRFGRLPATGFGKIHENVQRIKENEEVGVRFMNAWEEKILDRQEAYEEGHAEGLNEGVLQEKRTIAKKFKESGIPVVVIAKNTGLTEREVEAL